MPHMDRRRFTDLLGPLRETQEALVRSANELASRPPPETAEQQAESNDRNMRQNVDQVHARPSPPYGLVPSSFVAAN